MKTQIGILVALVSVSIGCASLKLQKEVKGEAGEPSEPLVQISGREEPSTQV